MRIKGDGHYLEVEGAILVLEEIVGDLVSRRVEGASYHFDHHIGSIEGSIKSLKKSLLEYEEKRENDGWSTKKR